MVLLEELEATAEMLPLAPGLRLGPMEELFPLVLALPPLKLGSEVMLKLPQQPEAPMLQEEVLN
jgi:hypothetical protein